MEDRIIKLIAAIGKISSQPKQQSITRGLNSSEAGVFTAIIRIVAEKPETELFSLSELNSYLNFTRPNLSQTINKLEDKGVVERVVLKDDRRVTYIKLTEDGKEKFKKRFDELFTKMKKISEKLGKEDTERLIDLLVKFADAYDTTSDEE